MPSQPAWFHRLDEILSALRSIESTRLDRLAVQKFFRVRQHRARQIMAGLEGLRVNNAAAASREALIARLEQTAGSGIFQWEGNRHAQRLPLPCYAKPDLPPTTGELVWGCTTSRRSSPLPVCFDARPVPERSPQSVTT